MQEVIMPSILAVKTDAGSGEYWWVYLVVAAMFAGALYKLYVNKIRKK